MIYFDNAADTYPKPTTFWNNSSIQGNVKTQLKKTIIEFFGAKHLEQVFLTPSAGEALYTVLKTLEFKREAAVYLSYFEPDVTVRTVSVRKYRDGIHLVWLPIDPNTAVPDWKALNQQFSLDPPAAVIVSQVGNLTGAITPTEDIFSKAHSYGAVTILDAAQSAGILPIEFDKMQADILIFSGHKKLYGKQGCGGLLCKEEKVFELLSEQLKEEEIQESILENLNMALLWGRKNQWEKLQKEQELSEKLLEGLQIFPHITTLGPALGKERTGIVTFAIRGYSANWLVDQIRQKEQICLRSAYEAAPYLSEWQKDAKAEEFVRASFGWFNTKEEVELLLKTIAKYIENRGGKE